MKISIMTFVVAVLLIASIGTMVVFFIQQGNEISNIKSQLTGTIPAGAQPYATPAASGALTMVDLIHVIQPVIVRIDVTGPGFQASGSGIIIRKDGFLITNQHVIDSATSITVTLSTGQTYPAAVSSSDATIDLAVVKITGAPSDLPAAVLGTDSDIVVGGTVTAAGFPLGSLLPGPASFTRGIVSAIRNLNGQNYIQSDVAINPGNSGGALVTNNGKVIGITSSEILPRGMTVVGIGLAIPINDIRSYILKDANFAGGI
jgi:serine protease Do